MPTLEVQVSLGKEGCRSRDRVINSNRS